MWTREYYVARLEDFAGVNLHVGAESIGVKRRVVRTVYWDREVGFPLRAKYERTNRTLEGIEENRDRPVPGPLPEDDLVLDGDGEPVGALGDDAPALAPPAIEDDPFRDQGVPVDGVPADPDVPGPPPRGEASGSSDDHKRRGPPPGKYGFERVRAGSTRPWYISREEWEKMSTKKKNEVRSEIAADPEAYAESYRRALEVSGSPASAGASAATTPEKPAAGPIGLSAWLPAIDAQLRVTLKKRVAKLARKRGVKPNDVVETLMELVSREFADDAKAPPPSAEPPDPDEVPAMPCVHPSEAALVGPGGEGYVSGGGLA